MISLRKILTGAILVAGLSGLAYTGIDAFQRHEVKKNDIKEIERSLEKQILEAPEKFLIIRDKFREIAKKQDSILGLQNFGEPEILFDENFKFGTTAPIDPKEIRRPPTGWYSRISNVIWVDSSKYDKSTLSHQRGHWYANKLSKSIGNGNWRSEIKSFIQELFHNIKGNKLISEGIATYFERKTDGKPIEYLSYTDFKKYFKGDSTDVNIYYDVGYALVAPILDEGIDRGIELLIKNPPTKRDLRDLVRYRERILRMMDKKAGVGKEK